MSTTSLASFWKPNLDGQSLELRALRARSLPWYMPCFPPGIKQRAKYCLIRAKLKTINPIKARSRRLISVAVSIDSNKSRVSVAVYALGFFDMLGQWSNELHRSARTGIRPIPKTRHEEIGPAPPGSHRHRGECPRRCSNDGERVCGQRLWLPFSAGFYITELAESDVDIKSLQTLARHSTPVLTMDVYAKARASALAAAVAKLPSRKKPRTQ